MVGKTDGNTMGKTTRNPKKVGIRCRNIFTAEKENALVDGYIFIDGRRIAGVFGEKQGKALLRGPFKDYEIWDYSDAFVMPGIHDFHVHLIIGAMAVYGGILRYAKSEEEAAEMLFEKNKDRKGDRWIMGGAWDHFGWPGCKLPGKESLDKYFKDTPVFLLNKECHGAWMNSKGLELFNITRDTPDPPKGAYFRDEHGEPTGYIHETAMEPIMKKLFSELVDEEAADYAAAFCKMANELGITSVGDVPVYGILKEKAYALAEKRGDLSLRVHFAAGMMEDLERIDHLAETHQGDRLRFIGVKDFLDGTPMGYSGYMLEPYSDREGDRSEPMIPDDVLNERVAQLDGKGVKIRLHACGDAAVRQGLDAYEYAEKVNGPSENRHTIEHIEAIAEEDISRFSKLGVVASVQPDHMPKYDFANHPFHRILGEERMRFSWPFGSLLSSGTVLAFGTDFPVSELSPFRGIYRAVHRLTDEGEPEGGFSPSERLNLYDALWAYTMGSAYAAGREEELGSLTEGKLADIVVLSENLPEIINDRERMFQTKALMTMVDGEVVYSNG